MVHVYISGLYGFCAVESSNFPRTRIVSEHYMARCKNKTGDEPRRPGAKRRQGLLSADVREVSLLGVLERGQKQHPSLLYSVTRDQPNADIFNVVQLSVQILSSSRCLFFGKILALLRYFDPGKMELCYMVGRNYIYLFSYT